MGIQASSARFKEAITPMSKASEAILAPANRSRSAIRKRLLNPEGPPSVWPAGRRNVAKVDPDLVVRDEAGKPFTVRYGEVNAMLLNEFLKEHHKVEKLEATVAALAAQLDKVAAQVQIKQPAMQVTVEKQ